MVHAIEGDTQFVKENANGPILMPPTLKKLKMHITLGLFISPFKIKERALKFHIWIPHKKITH